MSASDLEKVIHDVNSKCASLKDAAPLLRELSPGERDRLLDLMRQQAETLLRTLRDFPRSGGG